jgi:hypothetical protein
MEAGKLSGSLSRKACKAVTPPAEVPTTIMSGCGMGKSKLNLQAIAYLRKSL